MQELALIKLWILKKSKDRHNFYNRYKISCKNTAANVEIWYKMNFYILHSLEILHIKNGIYAWKVTHLTYVSKVRFKCVFSGFLDLHTSDKAYKSVKLIKKGNIWHRCPNIIFIFIYCTIYFPTFTDTKIGALQ